MISKETIVPAPEQADDLAASAALIDLRHRVSGHPKPASDAAPSAHPVNVRSQGLYLELETD